VVWSPQQIDVRNLSLESMGGSLHARGTVQTANPGSLPFRLSASIKNWDVKNVMEYNPLNQRYSLDGLLSIDAELGGTGGNWNDLRETLEGKAELKVSSGTLKNFNLAGSVLSDVNGLPGVVNLLSAGGAAEKKAVLQKKDTVFERLEASFFVEKGRFSSKNLTWVTEDYTVAGEGWIDLDRATKWNATLVMERGFSKAAVDEHRNIRFLLDRSGRLVVPFRVDGTILRMEVKPDVRRLIESIQRGLLRREPPSRQPAASAPAKRSGR
jgi:hypothetical protein